MQKKLIIVLTIIGIIVFAGISYATLMPSSPNTSSVPSILPPENTDDDLSAEEDALDEEYFTNETCTDNCEGPEAGYLWAEEHDIDDITACDTHPQGFKEGCQSFVEENYGYEEIE